MGRPIGAVQPLRPEGPAIRPPHRYRRETNKKLDSRTSSQKEEEIVGLPPEKGKPEENESQTTQAREYKDGEARGAEPWIIVEGEEKEKPRRKVKGEEDPSGKGPESQGKGRGHSGGTLWVVRGCQKVGRAISGAKGSF